MGKLIRFSESVWLNAPPEAVFELTQDYGRRLEWDTFLKKAELCANATKAGLGVRAWCVAHNGVGMETEYVSYRPPRVTAVKMTRGPWLFRSFAGSWNYKPEGVGTRMIFTYSCALRFPFTLVPFVVRMILRREMRQRLRDLKKVFGQTGP